jgi:CRP-like cAMP-binding protein
MGPSASFSRASERSVSQDSALRAGSTADSPERTGSETTRNGVPTWTPPPSVAIGPPGPRTDQVRLSLRIVIHLDRVGPPNEDGAARPESTQQGMAETLQTTQGAVSKVLRRLVAVDVVRQQRHHVRGVDRRVRVYFLSPRGAELAQAIRQRFGLPSARPLAG